MLHVQRLLVLLATAGLAFRAIAPGGTHAQVVAPVSFEVASVKPNTGDSQRVSFGFTIDGYTATNVPLRLLVMSAYGVRPSQVAGGPDWISVTRFDVVARASPGAPRDAFMLMLRTLLAERFTLAARLELREQPIYALVLNRADRRPGPALRPSVSECASGRPANPCRISGTIGAAAGNVNAIGQTMTDVAAYLGQNADRRVEDRTGLSGRFDFDLLWTAENLNAAPPAPAAGTPPPNQPPALFTALQEQLGLKLEPARGQVPFVVIERAALPTPD